MVVPTAHPIDHKVGIVKFSALFFHVFLGIHLFSPTTLLADMIADLKPAVVNFQVSNSKFFGLNQAGQYGGTGFIADRDRGLAVTNRHVAGEFPSQIKMTFVDGSSTLGKVVYYDATHDFSIVSFDPNQVEPELEQVSFGDFFDLKVGDDVVLLGNNEGEEYSVKHGVVVDLVKNKGDRHSLTFQTSFDRTGGSSGSPVFNEKGQVVGIHFKGTDTSSFELPINYVTDKLDDLIRGKVPVRGETGIQLKLVKIADAISHLDFPGDLAEKIRNSNKGLKHFLMVESVIRSLPAEKVLQAGDIIYSLEGVPIADKLYDFDKIVDQKTGQAIVMEVYSKGLKRKVEIPVLNAEEEKIDRFVTFGGATFHSITPELRLSLDVEEAGVYLSQAEQGSTFGSVGYTSKRNPDRKGLVVNSINGHPINSLDDLIDIASPLQHNQKISMTYKDHFTYAPATVALLILDLRISPLTVFTLDPHSHEWLAERQ